MPSREYRYVVTLEAEPGENLLYGEATLVIVELAQTEEMPFQSGQERRSGLEIMMIEPV